MGPWTRWRRIGVRPGLAFLTGMPDGADNALVDRMVAERRFAPC